MTGESQRRLSSRWLAVGVVLFAAVLVRYGWDWINRDGWETIDLAVYRWGGWAARESDELYSLRFNDFLPFTYTPFAAATFLPMTLFAWWAVQVGTICISVGALLITAGVSLRSLGYKLDRGGIGMALAIAAVGATLEPVDATLRFGQVNLILMAIVVGDLLLPDTSRFKGIGVGIATGFKLTPAIFIPYLLLTRRYTAALRAMATAAATVVLGFIILPAESSDFWFQHLFMDSTRVGGVAYVSNQSVNAFVIRLTDATSGSTALWLPAALIIAAFGFWTAMRVQRRGPELAAILVCAITGLLVSPVSWSHHWVWAVPALVLLVDLALRRTPWMWLAVAALTVSMTSITSTDLLATSGFIWRVPSTDDLEFTWTAAESAQGNLYILLGLAALGWAAWSTTRPPARERRSTDAPAAASAGDEGPDPDRAVNDRSARR